MTVSNEAAHWRTVAVTESQAPVTSSRPTATIKMPPIRMIVAWWRPINVAYDERAILNGRRFLQQACLHSRSVRTSVTVVSGYSLRIPAGK